MRDHTHPQRHDDLSISETCHIIEVDPATNDLSAAQQAVSERIAGLLNIDGLIFPCHMATLSANGSGSIVRYPSNKFVITLAKHLESEGLVTPFHCLLLDSTGFTARLIVRTKPRGN